MRQTKSLFENQIQKLKEDLLDLLHTVKKLHEDALFAIKNHEYDISEKMIQNDKEVRKVAESLTTTAIWRIASQQPFAGDLRTIIGYMNIIRDLERISNYAKNISKFNIKYKPETKLVQIMSALMKSIFQMFDLIDEAIETNDLNLAYKAAKKDLVVDKAYKDALTQIAKIIKESKDDDIIAEYSAGIHQIKYIERLGDHLVNICETIVYMIKGKFYDLTIPMKDQ